MLHKPRIFSPGEPLKVASQQSTAERQQALALADITISLPTSYEAGRLTHIGRSRFAAFTEQVRTMYKGWYKVDPKTQEFIFDTDEDREAYAGVNRLLGSQGIYVLMAEVGEPRQLTPEKLIALSEVDPDFFTACYEAALTCNPELDPEEAAEIVKRGTAQAQTRNLDGSVKTPEELAADPLEATSTTQPSI